MEVISSKQTKPNTNTKSSTYEHKRRSRNLCLAIIIIPLTFLLLLIILCFTVFKPKHPVTTINSINLDGIKVSLNIPKFNLDLNLTLIVNLSVKNPNKASFKYGNDSTALLYYRNEVIGQVILPPGKLSSDETKVMDAKLTVLADRVVTNSDLISDVVSGKLPLTTYTKMAGKVNVLNVFKHHVVSYSWCDIVIDVVNQSVGKPECRYKTKL